MRLFELKGEKIIFPSASTDKDIEKTNNLFGTKTVKISDYINENLTVTIGSKNGNKLETTLPIADILSLKNPNKRLLNKLKDYFHKK